MNATNRIVTPVLPALDPLVLDLGAASSVIVAPQTGQYRDVAEQCADAVAAVTGARPRIEADNAAPASLGAGPVIALGNLMASRLVRRLYLDAYDFTDFGWPSRGGSVIRTVRDPLGTGADVLLLGGSDPSGVSDAVTRLGGLLKDQGATLGYRNDIVLGDLAGEIHSYTERLLSDDDAIWNRVGESSWRYEKHIALAGLGYLRTGDEAYLPRFLDEFRQFAKSDLRNPRADFPPQVHGFFHLMLLVWDLLRDHPFFDEQTRRELDDDFLYFFYDPVEGPEHLRQDTRVWVVRDNHATMSALDAHFGGRYFWQRYRHEPALDWMDIAGRYFAPQLVSAKPIGDHWGHQWAFSLYNTLVYALATNNEAYCRGPYLKDAADRALIAHPTACRPHGYLGACAVATGDTGYGSGAGSVEAMTEQAATMRKTSPSGFGENFEIIRSFCTGDKTASRDDLLGIAEAPVDDLWNDTIAERGFNPDHVFACTTARNERFDKLSMREGWAPDDFYLLIDGISGGHHSNVDANCIKFLCERGVSWLSNDATTSDLLERLSQTTSVALENGVSVVMDGVGPGRLHRYARRLYAETSGDYLAIGTALGRLGRADWHRHVLRRRGAWTLVVDVVVAREAGDLLARRYWHVHGQAVATEKGLHSQVETDEGAVHFHLQSEGIVFDQGGEAAHPVETLRAKLGAHDALSFGALLHTTNVEQAACQLERAGSQWRVHAPEGVTEVTVSREGIAVSGMSGSCQFGEVGDPVGAMDAGKRDAASRLVLPRFEGTPWRTVDTGGGAITAVAANRAGWIATGDGSGDVGLFDPKGKRVFAAKQASEIAALHLLDDTLLVGEQGGVVSCLDRGGHVKWRQRIEYKVRSWSYLSEGSTRIRELGSGDLDGDGQDEIVVFCADRKVYVFKRDGTPQWDRIVTTGIPTAMTVGECEGAAAIYGGTARPSVHGWCLIYAGDGSGLRWYTREDLVVWSLRSSICDTRLVDVDGDGRLEMVNGVDSACRQLVVYRQGGVVLWDADVAGAARSIAVVPAGGARDTATVVCGSSAGWVAAFAGDSGKRLWQSRLPDAVRHVGQGREGEWVVLMEGGLACRLNDEGAAEEIELTAPVTAVPRPGDHRDHGLPLVLGMADGTVACGGAFELPALSG